MNLTDDGEPLNPVDGVLFEEDENGGIYEGDEEIVAFDDEEELLLDDAETDGEDALD